MTNIIELGFSRDEEAQKAFWNQQRGRVFLGVTAEELANDPEIVKIILQGVGSFSTFGLLDTEKLRRLLK